MIEANDWLRERKIIGASLLNIFSSTEHYLGRGIYCASLYYILSFSLVPWFFIFLPQRPFFPQPTIINEIYPCIWKRKKQITVPSWKLIYIFRQFCFCLKNKSTLKQSKRKNPSELFILTKLQGYILYKILWCVLTKWKLRENTN